MAPTPGTGSRWTQDSPGIRIPGPVARPVPASDGRESAQADLGSTLPSPVTLGHSPRERMKKMPSQPQKAVSTGK